MGYSFYLSAAHKSSGKTILSIGISYLFRQQYLVQTFKKGPDYIDPIWLKLASNNPCYNLDFYNMKSKEIKNLYQQNLKQVNIIEGNKGLFDGLNTQGGDANADLAKLLDIPVVLVIDTLGITRGIAPLLQGYVNFDKAVNIAGIILNKVSGDRHEGKLINAIKEYTDLSVFGAVHKSNSLIIDERHLGLKPAIEDKFAQKTIKDIANIINNQIDINKLLFSKQNVVTSVATKFDLSPKNMVIAIAKDESFGFYYADDLQKLNELGVKIVYFDTFIDKKLPKCDGLFIGGGFPETNLKKLSANKLLLLDIKQKINNGLPTYAECGGMMYLTKSIDNIPMVGVIDGDTITTKKPIGRGYMNIEAKNHPWKTHGSFKTHEFHYSKLINLKEKNFAFMVSRGVGINGDDDGIIKYNMLATYTHQRNVGNNSWVVDFINFIKTKK